MILFIRDNECFEPRVQNYLRYFEEHDIEYHVLAWNRNGMAQKNPHITFFEKRAEYGKRIANIPNKIAWMFYVIKECISRRHEYTAIHACDIDAILPALFIGKILRKTVIFDIFDWISSLTGKGCVYKLVEFLQNYAYKHSDCVILCEEERKSQAKAKNNQILILPNIPDGKTKFDQAALDKTEMDLQEYDYVVSYVGVFDKDRGLENLVDCISQYPNIKLNIAGFGVLNDLIEEYATKHSNICYWGRVEYGVGQAIMKNSNLIAAMYHLTSPLHKYAAPNKYYESLVLGVPMITTQDTLVGAKVIKYDTGFVLDETKESLLQLFRNPHLTEEISKKSENCKITWHNIYSTYFEDYMTKKYMKIIQEKD